MKAKNIFVFWQAGYQERVTWFFWSQHQKPKQMFRRVFSSNWTPLAAASDIIMGCSSTQLWLSVGLTGWRAAEWKTSSVPEEHSRTCLMQCAHQITDIWRQRLAGFPVGDLSQNVFFSASELQHSRNVACSLLTKVFDDATRRPGPLICSTLLDQAFSLSVLA